MIEIIACGIYILLSKHRHLAHHDAQRQAKTITHHQLAQANGSSSGGETGPAQTLRQEETDLQANNDGV